MTRRWISVLLILMMAVTVIPGKAYAANDGGDSVFDKTSDSFATIGKSGADKAAILFRRRSERAAKRMRESMNESGKKISQEMGKLFDSK